MWIVSKVKSGNLHPLWEAVVGGGIISAVFSLVACVIAFLEGSAISVVDFASLGFACGSLGRFLRVVLRTRTYR